MDIVFISRWGEGQMVGFVKKRLAPRVNLGMFRRQAKQIPTQPFTQACAFGLVPVQADNCSFPVYQS